MSELSVRREGEVTVIEFPDESVWMRETEVGEVAGAFLTAVQTAQPRKVLVDLSRVEFFSSSFIELLVRAWNRIRGDADGQFALCGVSEYCREVLEVTHIDRMWPQYKTRAEGLAALQTATGRIG